MSPDAQNETPSTITAPPSEVDHNLEKISVGKLSTISAGPPEMWKKGGRLLSGLLALNVLLLSCALVSAGAFDDVGVAEREVLSFLSAVMGLSGCWMVLYLLWTSRRQSYIHTKDSHAGPIWLRGGLALFGVCTLILDVLKIGKAASLGHCMSVISIVHPIIQCLFVVIQTYFLWVSCKDCVQVHMNLTRCGLMLTLSTNLAIWMAAVTEESLHQAVYLEDSNISQHTRAGGSGGCTCTSNVCKIFETGYYYLYPFNIEYSLFATTMAYVMWKNVGRIMSEHAHHTQHKFHVRSLYVGIVLGTGVFVAGLAVFIVYEVEMGSENPNLQYLNMFYIFNIVALGLMSVSAIAGSIIYRFDKRHMDEHKNPTRTLDVALLVGAALGQYCISFYCIVAIIAKTPQELHHTLNLVYSLFMLIQHTAQNVFIIEGLHREPFHEESRMPNDKDLFHSVLGNQAAITSHNNHSGTDHGSELGSSLHGTLSHPIIKDTHTNWRRKGLREISQFLLICNIIFWIMPAFGARPEFDNTLQLKFYGNTLWAAIVNIGLPFGIFYRMHSVASLLEVYIMS
ncbi:proton channel OTOP2-like [Discoglossus pictus]